MKIKLSFLRIVAFLEIRHIYSAAKEYKFSFKKNPLNYEIFFSYCQKKIDFYL